MSEKRELLLEELFIDVVVKKLSIEGFESELLVLIGANLLLLSSGKVALDVALDAVHKVLEALEVGALGAEFGVEMAVKVEDAGVLRFGVGGLENQRGNELAVAKKSQILCDGGRSCLCAHFVSNLLLIIYSSK